MDERDIHCRGNLLRDFEAKIQPLINLIMPTIQRIHGEQEEFVGVRQGIIRRIVKYHDP